MCHVGRLATVLLEEHVQTSLLSRDRVGEREESGNPFMPGERHLAREKVTSDLVIGDAFPTSSVSINFNTSLSRLSFSTPEEMVMNSIYKAITLIRSVRP